MAKSQLIKFLLILTTLTHISNAEELSNVCNDFSSYFLEPPFNKNCFYNEDVGKSSQELMKRYNYTFETYNMKSLDDYLVGMFRIPGKGKPVLLLHGLFTTSQVFLSHDNRSLAFALSDEGYDVYMGDFRGNIYSNGHANKNITPNEYWNFSFQENGFYDIPVMVEQIKQIRKAQGLPDEKVRIIGWALGCVASVFYSAANHTHSITNTEALICMSPTVYFNHVTNPAIFFLFTLINSLRGITHKLGLQYVGIHNENDMMLIYDLCLHSPLRNICYSGLYLLLTGLVPPEALPLLISSFGGTTLRSFEHYAQLIDAKNEILYRDLGSSENLRVYNQEKPPALNLSSIDITMKFLYGLNDNIGTATDAINICNDLKQLGKDIDCVLIGTEQHAYSHMDFLKARDVNTVLHKKLLEILNQI